MKNKYKKKPAIQVQGCIINDLNHEGLSASAE